MKFESLRNERDHWRTRAEAKQRLQDKKEEACELFQRQPRLGVARREEFEREYKQKAQKVLTFRFCPVPMKSLSKRGWKICSKSLWHKTERWKPERGRAWGRRIPPPRDVEHGRRYGIRESSPCRRSLQLVKLSRDVSPDVELVALVSSVETTFCSNSIWSMLQR